MARGVTKGDPEAPVTIVEFGDYQCPACGAFAMQVKAQMELTLVETGQAKFVFYDFPLVSTHANAFLAARAARCAEDQDMFWEYHDELFRQQARWSGEVNAAGSFTDYAGDVGLDTGAFSACLNSDRHADVVTANMQLGQRMGVNSTPTILVNNGRQTRRAPSFDLPSIQAAIDAVNSAPGSN